MPSQTAASALVKLYSFNGAIWQWPVWQEHTGIYHGLFPQDNSHLLKGWTCKNAVDIQLYFRAYQLLPNKEKKLTFSTKTKGSSEYPGHDFWKGFIAKKWDSWNIHTAIIAKLKDIDAPWPSADMYLPIILDSLALRLFLGLGLGENRNGKE